MSEEHTEAKYLPKGVRFFQKAIKHRDDAIKKEARERKKTRDRLRAQLKREVKTQLLANIEEIDSELLARIAEMRDDEGVLWDCGSGERGEMLAGLLHDHYTKEGLTVRVEHSSVQISTQVVYGAPAYYLRLNIPEEAVYQKRGRLAHLQRMRAIA